MSDDITASVATTVTSQRICLRYELEKRYCWPLDGTPICEVCEQLLRDHSSFLARMIDTAIGDRIMRILNEGHE